MALRGLKLTWVCIASLFISCSIILSFKFKNSTFFVISKTLFLLFLRSGKLILFIKKRRKNFVEQAIGELTRKLIIKVKSQQIMYKRDGVVRLSQSTLPKYGVNVHNVRVHLINISLHEICDLALRLYRQYTLSGNFPRKTVGLRR